MSVTLGNMVTLRTTVTVDNVLTDDPGITLTVLKPDGTTDTFNLPDVTRESTGVYSFDYLPATIGIYVWRWFGDADAQGASEGTIEVESIYSGQVTDLRDLRVLIPACRRAIDGPMATASDSPSTTLDDAEVLGLLADSTAELILFTQETFGLMLEVTARDAYYMAPVSWQTNNLRTSAADAAILSQAALDHYFYVVKNLRTQETLKNEAQEWSYTVSANIINAWIQYLMDNRNKALAALQVINAPLDVYFSLVAERDRLSAAWLEPWVAEIGAPVPYVGGGGSGPLEYDFRFNTWG